MGVLRVELSGELKRIMDRQIADGLAESEAAYVEEAIRLHAEALQADGEWDALMARAEADVAAGRYVTIEAPADAEALRANIRERVKASLPKN